MNTDCRQLSSWKGRVNPVPNAQALRAHCNLVLCILYCMAMRGIPEYIAQARTTLHASVGQVQYGPSAGNIFWYPPNIKAMQYNYYYS